VTAPEIEFLDEPAVDKNAAAPHGIPCEACGTPVEKLDRFCPACGTPNPRYDAPPVVDAELAEDEKHKYFRCQQCGAEVATDPGQLSYTCPFCDSNYVAEYSPDMSGRQLPEFVIGFAVTPQQAHEKFKQWLRDNPWYRPGDLVGAAVADKMKGIYLPFWSFSMLAESTWEAQIGEYWYRTETYTTMENGKMVTKTRQVQETEWWPLDGNHHRYYSGYLVSGSKGLPQQVAERILPFNLPALKRYEPYFLAGWLSEQYSIARDEALLRCQQEFYRREQQNVAAHLPGDTHSGLAVRTNFGDVNSDLCLLPVYVLSYKYQDKLYRFLVNGQTGKIAGDKPLSWQRIWIAVGAVFGAVLLVVLLIFILSQIFG
jgi:Zn finger protein HypA/HybF involved in hydrogenase expression